MPNPRLSRIDFAEPSACEGWQAIDDRVMGGLSRSRLRHDPSGHAVFEGNVLSDNGGGFASIRHRSLALGSPATSGYCLEVLGDGKRYKLNLRTDPTFDGVNHQAEFEPPAGVWTVIDIPVTAFVTTRRGRVLTNVSQLDPGQVCQVGLVIGDRQWGPFALGLRSIACTVPSVSH